MAILFTQTLNFKQVQIKGSEPAVVLDVASAGGEPALTIAKVGRQKREEDLVETIFLFLFLTVCFLDHPAKDIGSSWKNVVVTCLW